MINEEIDILKLDNDLKQTYSKQNLSYDNYIKKKRFRRFIKK